MLTMYPYVQQRAWEEIDAVTGRLRLPLFRDKSSMPYIEAICREVLHWMLVVPLGLYRRAINNDVYDRWLIPAGKYVDQNHLLNFLNIPPMNVGAIITWNTW